jgi:ubiquinone/menaquinone biosynthesis C-methylase UbiE
MTSASKETVDEEYLQWLNARPRRALARRTLESHGRFLIPHLKPGMRVLDVGCGPGSITRDIAAYVAPGNVIGIDTDEGRLETARQAAPQANLEHLTFELGDANALAFDDASFDVVFMHAVLQHAADPLKILRGCRRVLRADGIVGVADTDLSACVVYPTDPTLDEYFDYLVRLRKHEGGSANVGRQLRALLHEAGFEASLASLDARADGDAESVPRSAEAFASPLEALPLIAYVEAHGIARREDLKRMAQAWRNWGAQPGAIWTRMWFHAIGRPRSNVA